MIKRKPGYMGRAVIAWFILNAVALFILAAIVYIVGNYIDRWFVMIPLLIGIVVSEWTIMAETIAPILSDWIKQEESIQTGEKASWEK